MEIVTHTSLPWEPVSHDPGILKQVILRNGSVANVTQVSHVILRPGQHTVAHEHSDMTEIYTLVSGVVIFHVDGTAQSVSAPATVVIQPGEEHSISNKSDAESDFQYMGIRSTRLAND